MSEMTTMDVANKTASPAQEERTDRRADWLLAAAFFGSVLAIYAALAYALYAVIF